MYRLLNSMSTDYLQRGRREVSYGGMSKKKKTWKKEVNVKGRLETALRKQRPKKAKKAKFKKN